MDNVVFSSKDVTSCMTRILCKRGTGIKICHINAQSLRNKIDEFSHIFEGSGVDIICVSETWFEKSVTDSIVELKGFRLYRCDRKTPCGLHSGADEKKVVINIELLNY